MDTVSQPLDAYKKRRRATRERLVTAARSVMASKNIEAVTIDEITQVAEVGKGSFYNHFKSKEELFLATLDDVLAGIFEHITAAIRNIDDPAEVLSIAIRLHIKLATADPGIGRLLVNAPTSLDFFNRYADPIIHQTIDSGVESGRFEISDRDLFFTLLTGGLSATLLGQLDGKLGKATEVEFARFVLLMAGLDRRDADAVANKDVPDI
ncbi:MAG: TetR/AcrR family transcriptional regulator [Pseudomonadota bacterium]